MAENAARKLQWVLSITPLLLPAGMLSFALDVWLVTGALPVPSLNDPKDYALGVPHFLVIMLVPLMLAAPLGILGCMVLRKRCSPWPVLAYIVSFAVSVLICRLDMLQAVTWFGD